MNFSSSNRGFPAGNPIANVLVIIVGALVIAASIVLGFMAFIFLGSIILMFAAVVGIRLWWFNRKLRKAGMQRVPGDGRPKSPAGVIEGEFIVVDEERDD